MDSTNINIATRLGAYSAIFGGLSAVAGAALWLATGTDLDAALVNRDMVRYLTAAGENYGLLVANLTI